MRAEDVLDFWFGLPRAAWFGKDPALDAEIRGRFLAAYEAAAAGPADDLQDARGALARVVLGAPPGPTLWFNYRTARTERWAEATLMERHGHHTRFPDPADPEGGVVLDLPARSAGSGSVGPTH